MWPYPWTHVGTPSHLGQMDRLAARKPSQAHAGAAQEAPDIVQWEGQDVPLVRPSSCIVKGSIPSSRRYLPTYLSTVAQQAQLDHALTHRGHTPLGAAHATAYVHARDLTAAVTNHRALPARDGHTPVQRRLRIRKGRLSGVAILPQPCLLCGSPEETPVHMHVGCAQSRFLWPRYPQGMQEAARHLTPGDKALWVASWRSAGAAWTEVFCSGLVPRAAKAQLRTIARYHPPGGTSVDNSLQHMLRLGDFVWELRNCRLEQLLRNPLSAAASVHRWLTAKEGDCPPPCALAGASWPPSVS